MGMSGRYDYYRCRGRQVRGRSYCDNDTLPKEALENAVLTQVVSLLSQSDLLEKAWRKAETEKARACGSLDSQLKHCQSGRARLEKARQRYFRAFEEGSLNPSAFQERLAELSEQLARIAEHEAAIISELSARGRRPFPVQALEQLRCQLAAFDADSNPAQAKAVLRLLIAEIAVSARDEIQPRYRIQLNAPPNPVRELSQNGDSPARPTGGARS